MAINGNFTLFRSSAGAGASASDYLKDVFKDVSLPATNNTGFTDNADTNPLGGFFNDDDAPKYGWKQLSIKNFEVISDRSKWIDNKPTYLIEFKEGGVGVLAYAYGDVRLGRNKDGLSVSVNQVGDGFGITGVIRKAGWLVAPNVNSSATANILIDGTDTTNDVTFSDASAPFDGLGQNKQFIALASTSNQTEDIHDYRLTVNNKDTLTITGIVVYFENSGANIELFPGNTYVDKTKSTTTVGATLDLAGLGIKGGRTVISKTAANAYTQESVEPPGVTSIATGSSGTNLLTVAAGDGSSFPIGSGIAAFSGTSAYLGTVLNVSTDTLTVSPTLGFGISGDCYKLFQTGASYAISSTLYQLDYEIDFANLQNDNNSALGFAEEGNSGNLQYIDPQGRYSVYGFGLNTRTDLGYYGVGFANSSTGILYVDAYASACEIIYAASEGGGIHATFHVSFGTAQGVLQGVTGLLTQTVFTDAGPGMKSFFLQNGASTINCNIHRLRFYRLADPVGSSFGQLASYETLENVYKPDSVGLSTITPGTYRRVYADQLYYEGDWRRITDTFFLGQVTARGVSTNCTFKYNYFGKDFAIIGESGASGNLTIDGASISSDFNTLQSVATLGFHELEYTHLGSTVQIGGIDITNPVADFNHLQNFDFFDEQKDIPAVYETGDTPRNPKAGDVWADNKDNKFIWVYLWEKWNRLRVDVSVDDPNGFSSFYFASGASNGNGDSTNNTQVRRYDFASYQVAAAIPSARYSVGLGDGSFRDKMYVVAGLDSTANVTTSTQEFNAASWATLAAISAGRHAMCYLGFKAINLLVVANGASTTNTGNSGAATSVRTFDGTSWTVFGDTSLARNLRGTFEVNAVMSLLAGRSTTDTTSNGHETFDGSSIGSSTVTPTSAASAMSCNSPGGRGIVGYENTTNTNEWDGSSWSSAIVNNNAKATTMNGRACGAACAFVSSVSRAIFYGRSAAGSSFADQDEFDGTSFIVLGISGGLARAGAGGGAI